VVRIKEKKEFDSISKALAVFSNTVRLSIVLSCQRQKDLTEKPEMNRRKNHVF
jgi:hypothetical protein